MDKNRFNKQIGSVTAATLISRILGYIRDMLIAYMFGAHFIADAFYAAYRIPNLFRRLFGEGSVSASFVPVFTEYNEIKSRDETQKLLSVTFTMLLIIVTVITGLGMIFSEQITRLIATGFATTPEKMNLAISLTRIMFPYFLFVSLAALMLGVLNSLRRFFLPALASSLLNVSEILFILIFAGMLVNPVNQVKWLAVSVVVGGFGQYIVQQIAVIKQGFRFRLKWDLSHPGLRKIFFLIIPVMVGFSVDQINELVNQIFASFLEHGSIAVLYYSNRIMQFPLALFGLSVTTVALPLMSANVANNQIDKMKETLNFSLRMICFMLIPSTVGLVILGLPIIQVLFEHGKFGADASLKTYYTLSAYSLGLAAYGMSKIFASAFYSFKETKVPVRTAVICLLLNVALNFLLVKRFEVAGLAMSASISSWANAILLGYFLHKRIGKIGARQVIETFVKVLLASVIMGITVFLLLQVNYPYRALLLLVPLAAGILVYFLMCMLLKIEEYKSILRITSV